MLQNRHWQTEKEILVAAGQGGGRDLERTAAIGRESESESESRGDRIGGGRMGSFTVTVTNRQWGHTPAFRLLQTGRIKDMDRLKGDRRRKR